MIVRVDRLAAALAGVAAVVLLSTACSSVPRDPIVVEEGTIVVENQTARDWRNVIIRVNDHFAGGAPLLAAGSRLNAPLSQFQTAYGQKFDRGRQSVVKVEVTATDADGNPVVVTWTPQPQKQSAFDRLRPGSENGTQIRIRNRLPVLSGDARDRYQFETRHPARRAGARRSARAV